MVTSLVSIVFKPFFCTSQWSLVGYWGKLDAGLLDKYFVWSIRAVPMFLCSCSYEQYSTLVFIAMWHVEEEENQNLPWVHVNQSSSLFPLYFVSDFSQEYCFPNFQQSVWTGLCWIVLGLSWVSAQYKCSPWSHNRKKMQGKKGNKLEKIHFINPALVRWRKAPMSVMMRTIHTQTYVKEATLIRHKKIKMGKQNCTDISKAITIMSVGILTHYKSCIFFFLMTTRDYMLMFSQVKFDHFANADGWDIFASQALNILSFLKGKQSRQNIRQNL